MEDLFKYTISQESDKQFYLRRNGMVMQCARQKIPLNTVTKEGQGITYTFCCSNCPLFDAKPHKADNNVKVTISCGSETREYDASIIESPEPKPAEVVTNKDKTKSVVPTGKGGEA